MVDYDADMQLSLFEGGEVLFNTGKLEEEQEEIEETPKELPGQMSIFDYLD